MEMRYYLRIIQRGWWIILIAALVFVNLSLLNSYYLTTPMYEAVARFIVSPNLQNIGESRDLVNSIEALDKRSIVSTYAEVLNSPNVVEGTIKLLQQNPEEYKNYTTSVTVLPDANILRFTVRGPDPEVVTSLANSIGQHAIDYIRDIYLVYDIDFLDNATIPLEPYAPRPAQEAGLALLIGTIFGIGLAFVRDQLSGALGRLSERRMIDNESLAYTRMYFERQMREEIARNPDANFTIGFVYLNGIQDFYDSLPQAYINKIMRRVTDTLKLQLRGNDIIGRWSPLKFSVLLPSTDGTSAKRTIARVQETLAQPYSLDGVGEYNISLDPRIGLSARQWGESMSTLIDQAEQALDIAMQSEIKIELYKVRPFV